MQRQAITFLTLHTALFTLHTCTSHSTLHLISDHVNSSHLISALLISFPSPLTCHVRKFFSTVFISSEHWSTSLISSKLFLTHLSGSARQKALTVREKSLTPKKTIGRRHFRTQKLETQMHLHRKAFTKYFVLQSLYKAIPSTTLYYKACTKHFPVLLCTTKLAQSTSQYYFVLQSLRKALPCTTLYHKACTKYSPVLLCSTKLAQSSYKACTKHVPVLLCTTKLAQSTSQY